MKSSRFVMGIAQYPSAFSSTTTIITATISSHIQVCSLCSILPRSFLPDSSSSGRGGSGDFRLNDLSSYVLCMYKTFRAGPPISSTLDSVSPPLRSLMQPLCFRNTNVFRGSRRCMEGLGTIQSQSLTETQIEKREGETLSLILFSHSF